MPIKLRQARNLRARCESLVPSRAITCAAIHLPKRLPTGMPLRFCAARLGRQEAVSSVWRAACSNSRTWPGRVPRLLGVAGRVTRMRFVRG